MADTKISALTALTGANLASNDLLPAVDVSDTTMAASGTDKKMSASELATGMFLLQDGKVAPRSLPTGGLAATYNRGSGGSALSILTSGTLWLIAVDLISGQVITSVSFKSGSTGAGTPTHQWFGIADSSRAVQRWTNDDTTTAWAATTVKTLNLTSTYTVPTTGVYYLALLVAATTVPTIFGNGGAVQLNNIAPILSGPTSDTGLTTPPGLPFTASAITANLNLPYGWVA